jgi:hypothetical protein
LDGRDKRRDVLLAAQFVGVAGMLIVCPQWLNETDCRQAPVSEIRKKAQLTLEVRRFGRSAVGVVRVIGEGLVMELEERIRTM